MDQSDGNHVDTNNNAGDFYFVDTNGTSTAAGQRLGAPGPQNLASPIQRNAQFSFLLLDSTASAVSLPNRARDLAGDPANNSSSGTIEFRRRVSITAVALLPGCATGSSTSVPTRRLRASPICMHARRRCSWFRESMIRQLDLLPTAWQRHLVLSTCRGRRWTNRQRNRTVVRSIPPCPRAQSRSQHRWRTERPSTSGCSSDSNRPAVSGSI